MVPVEVSLQVGTDPSPLAAFRAPRDNFSLITSPGMKFRPTGASGPVRRPNIREESPRHGPCCGVNSYAGLNFCDFKVPAEFPRCTVEESMGEKGSACSVDRQ